MSERTDDLQLDGLRIIQDTEGFCFGMDAVLLSAFIPPETKGDLIDLGTGTGVLPLLLSAKTSCRHLTGLEIQKRSAELAERSVRLNGLTDRITIIQGDIREAEQQFASASFDIVTSNPPYMTNSHGLLPSGQDNPRSIARHEILCTLRDVTRAAAHLLKHSGHFYMVHRPFRLPEILEELRRAGIEPKRMRMVHPFLDKEPNMVLIDAVRGGRPRLKVEPPLIVYEREGVYTAETGRIYGI